MIKFADEAMYNQQKEWEQEQEYQASESAKAEADAKAQEEMEMASDIKKIEEVKNILRKFREQIEEEHYGAQLEAEAKICQLFETESLSEVTPKEKVEAGIKACKPKPSKRSLSIRAQVIEAGADVFAPSEGLDHDR